MNLGKSNKINNLRFPFPPLSSYQTKNPNLSTTKTKQNLKLRGKKDLLLCATPHNQGENQQHDTYFTFLPSLIGNQTEFTH